MKFVHLRREAGGPGEELIWVQVRLDADWVAAYRLVPQDGRLVIGEQRVLPYEEDARIPGEWSGAPQSTPPGGVPGDKPRQLQRDRVLRAVQKVLEDIEDKGKQDKDQDGDGGRRYLERVLPRFDLDRGLVLSDPVSRRHRRPAADVAQAAAYYADAPDGERLQLVAEKMCCSKSNASKLIRDARSRGFLTGGGRGRAGGELTQRGREALA